METAAVEVGQTPLLTVHKKVLVPVLMPVTFGLEILLLEREADPASTDQTPVPKVWVIAASVELPAQII